MFRDTRRVVPDEDSPTILLLFEEREIAKKISTGWSGLTMRDSGRYVGTYVDTDL